MPCLLGNSNGDLGLSWLHLSQPSPTLEESTQNPSKQPTYDARLHQIKTATTLNQTHLKPIEVIHGVPTIQFTTDERGICKRGGATSSYCVKLSSNTPDLSILRTLLPKVFGIKGQCLPSMFCCP